MSEITANAENLMRQAPMTAAEYLRAAVESIDGEFGKGYAKDNPSLVGEFMRASCSDFSTAIIAKHIAEHAEVIGDAIRKLQP